MKWIVMFLLPLLLACDKDAPSGREGEVTSSAPAPVAAAVQASPSNDTPADHQHAPVTAGDDMIANSTIGNSKVGDSTETATPATSRSRYSSIAEADCKFDQLDEEVEVASSYSRCPGLGGYRLGVLDSDARMSIDVIAPDGSTHPLDLWSVVSTGFSRLGDTAEWRYSAASQAPDALIVRFVVSENSNHPGSERTTSYLVVAKLSGQPVCVIGKIAPGPQQNERARQLADRAATMPCLQADDQAGF